MKNDFEMIEGWCSGYMQQYSQLIDAYHKDENVNGGIAEIGVHHGKFFILLNWLTEKNEESYAIDLFDDQHLNIDQSGCGSLEIFKKNLLEFDKHQGNNVNIVIADSTTYPLEKDILKPVRIFSVDGGHTVEHTLSDLKLAHKLIHKQGVVILDDITNMHWLGVIEGCIRFLEQKPTLVPFAIGQNKMFLCNLSYADSYKNIFKNSGYSSKDDVMLCGHKIIALHH